MSDLDLPVKDAISSKIEPRVDSTASKGIDCDPTLDIPESPSSVASPADPSSSESRSIGRYRLVKKLGQGGMGQVWLAEQTAPVRRQVALKLIRAGMYDDSVLQRFQLERQSLAIMDHPAIAKVFDAGATPEGQPYFVMEYVPGPPITDYCDQKKLAIGERLELFIKVCEGVQHAHQKAIIHRDLKPANIQVVEVDGQPMPRIIDFGLAKAITRRTGDETLFTKIGGWVGTPGYMSPEQIDPNVKDIDTRTDVYSLGVVLYVLLAGTLPFDPKDWQSKPMDHMLRHLREEDPPLPSTRVSMQVESSHAIADVRATEPKQLVRALQGDLDWITMKAVEKDRTRRYATPSELIADIDRYLRHEPVLARPASTTYRMRKYIRRHRISVAVAAGVVTLLVGFAAAQAVQLRRITRERDRANRIAEFMIRMFKVSDPSEARGNSIAAREILDKASNDIETGLAKDPELQANMMDVMGNVYDNLGLYHRAQPLLEHALDIQRRALGLEHADTARSMNDLSGVLAREGRYPEAEKLYRETVDIRRRVLGPEHPSTLLTMNGLANVLADEGRYAEAERLYREALDIQRRVLGLEHPDTLRSMMNLAANLRDEGHYAEAEKLERETLEIQRRVLGPEHPNTLLTMNNLANVFGDQGRHAEAEKLYRETLDIQRHVLGPEHPNTLLLMGSLANSLSDQGHYVEAEKLDRETLDIKRRVLGPEHPLTLATMNNLGNALMSQGHDSEAEKLFAQTLAIQRRVLGPEHPNTAITTYNLGVIAARQGHLDMAFSLLRGAIDHGLPAGADLGIDKDPDLNPLHSDSRFNPLAAYARQRAAAAQKPN